VNAVSGQRLQIDAVSIEEKSRTSTAEPRGNEVTRIGVLTPHLAPGPEAEFPAMAPGRVMTCVARVPAEGAAPGIGGNPTTPSGLLSLADSSLLDAQAAMFRLGTLDAIVYASTGAAYAIGFDNEEAVVSRLARRAGLPVLATGTSAVRALRVLQVGRVALVHPPWFDPELNDLGADYFRAVGFEVAWSKLAGVSRDPRRVESSAVYEWTVRNVTDDADAVFIGGNGFRAAGAIARLEDALRRPVLTSNQVLLWRVLVATGATFEVSGYGRLFAHITRPDA